VERETLGSVQVQLFPNRQLGDERQMLEGMRFGTVDAGIITNAVIAQIEPAFSVNDLPFLFANEAQAHKVLDGAVGAELAKRLSTKGIVALGYMEGGFRNMINNKRPVNAPGDVAGVKYRVMQNPVFIDMFNSMGGSAIPMAWGETFTAVQQGTIDGLEIPLAVIDAILGRKETGMVFPAPRRPGAGINLNPAWAAIRKHAALPDVRLHDLRHSFASFLVNAGRSLYEVQELLGHASVTTTQIYTLITIDKVRESYSLAHPRAK
jgi:TRAP-type mannitol/chloroaromatic compound transport system substrate-binding protein